MNSLQRTLSRFLGRERDEIAEALADLERQGSASARIAHIFAMLLVVLFSAGSLVALGSDAMQSVLTQWNQHHTLDIPSAITLAVSFLMVLAMDTGMLVAASTLRVLAARRAPVGEKWIHIAIMAGVAIIEAATYWYMSVKFEQPATGAAQALIIARAVAAPILAVYLSMSRPLPVTSRDIMGQVELASGRGLLRDVTAVANDRTAPLERKMKLYSASAIMAPAERARLAEMITAVQETGDSAGSNSQGVLIEPSESPYMALQEATGSIDMPTGADTRIARFQPPESQRRRAGVDPERPPTGPGSPTARTTRASRRAGGQKNGQHRSPQVIPLTQESQDEHATPRRLAASLSAEERVRSVWRPGLTVSEIERAAAVSRSTAHKWRQVLIREEQERGQTAK